jgi:hypothetical protein
MDGNINRLITALYKDLGWIRKFENKISDIFVEESS